MNLSNYKKRTEEKLISNFLENVVAIIDKTPHHSLQIIKAVQKCILEEHSQNPIPLLPVK